MKKRLLLPALLACSTLHHAHGQSTPTFRDPKQPLTTRVNDLISKLTLEEKAQQMLDQSPAIPRLGIPAYSWWNEALHGVGRSAPATVFPEPIGLAATFDEDLAKREATAISDEARAVYNAAIAKNHYVKYGGLTFWTPNVNIFRDPRWGRGQETYGEDPTLTARLGVSFVQGLQGDDPRYLKVAACAKHYAVHSGPEKLRHEFNAVASPQDLRETYLPAFKALVKEANVEAVMCAYNATNGEPCCGNTFLLQDVLRKEWGFRGHVVSDCGALDDLYEGHKTVKTKTEAAALALQRGVELNCGDTYTKLPEAVRQGLLKETQVDSALAILLRTRFKLGLFDPQNTTPYDKLGPEIVNSPAHRALAKEVALKSMVLLKNNGVLPLRSDLGKYFVTGPNATSVEALLGNYYGVNSQMTTILEGLVGAVQPGSQIEYKQGALLDRANINPIDWTTGEAKTTDAIFLVMGITGVLEGEEGESIASPHAGDRIDYNLPKNQIDFLKKLRKNSKTPIIAIVTGGSPMNLAEVHELADAVLLTWYPGEEGGNAVADIVFGKVSPSGKLPITFPQSLDQLPAYESYGMLGRTYRYMSAEPMYPFGYGLSYAKFEYSGLKLPKKAARNKPVEVEATVRNTGKMAGEEVVQLYLTHPPRQGQQIPRYALKNFRRVALQPGASATIKFTLTPEQLALIDAQGKSVAPAGQLTVAIGGALPSARSQALGASPAATAVLVVK
ncbi:glycoside hydrolase family 3 C-terminal domain-containing protein [Hymenobacter sp. BT186]|uniref:Glycoside hydrolase family 3 C-terminal domain-containing protein n=1 Tax=Hymenobacter telluris TaxID=2816474 RepID=A0A939JD97_9BACT|nr:glycoside hydrolase family 3 N-terminal domain-containing protein [Hymenobacter telluris]MBO0359170.1 glycoside hydrolase family 3 C-terminal domain-containing protein [Hymenobacter telluris]MBW3375196.1 glycoside hydrolase family 3 C-terminal domain-containing protein [Hymenobacter norwichensis]